MDEGSKPLDKDFAHTRRLITKELAHIQDQANALSCAGHVSQLTIIMAMDPGGACPTEWTTGGSLCRNSRKSDHLLRHITAYYF